MSERMVVRGVEAGEQGGQAQAAREAEHPQGALAVSVLLFAVIYLWGVVSGLAALSKSRSGT
jgi:hypothetical protein